MIRRTLALSALLLLPASAAHAAPFTNGSFELASGNPGSGFFTLGAGSTFITGWEVLGTSIDYIGTYWEAAEGSRSIDLNGALPGGGVRQTFDTATGGDYRVDFALAGNPDGIGSVPLLKTVQVQSGSFLGSFDFLIPPGTSRTDMNWAYYSFVFTAAGPSTTLSFLSTTPASHSWFGPALDDVSVTPVPEPATVALIGLGLAGLAVRRRRQ